MQWGRQGREDGCEGKRGWPKHSLFSPIEVRPNNPKALAAAPSPPRRIPLQQLEEEHAVVSSVPMNAPVMCYSKILSFLVTIYKKKKQDGSKRRRPQHAESTLLFGDGPVRYGRIQSRGGRSGSAAIKTRTLHHPPTLLSLLFNRLHFYFLRGKKNAPLDISGKERSATQQHAKDDPALRTPRLALATAKLLPYSAGEGGRTGSESIENRIDRMALLAADHGGAAHARTFLGCSSLLRTGPIVAVVCHTIDPLLFSFKKKD